MALSVRQMERAIDVLYPEALYEFAEDKASGQIIIVNWFEPGDAPLPTETEMQAALDGLIDPEPELQDWEGFAHDIIQSPHVDAMLFMMKDHSYLMGLFLKFIFILEDDDRRADHMNVMVATWQSIMQNISQNQISVPAELMLGWNALCDQYYIPEQFKAPIPTQP